MSRSVVRRSPRRPTAPVPGTLAGEFERVLDSLEHARQTACDDLVDHGGTRGAAPRPRGVVKACAAQAAGGEVIHHHTGLRPQAAMTQNRTAPQFFTLSEMAEDPATPAGVYSRALGGSPAGATPRTVVMCRGVRTGAR